MPTPCPTYEIGGHILVRVVVAIGVDDPKGNAAMGGRNKHLIATGVEPAIIEELMKGYQRPEDLAGAGAIIEQFRRRLLPSGD